MVDEYLHLYSLVSKLTVKMKPMTGKGNKPSEVFFLEEKKKTIIRNFTVSWKQVIKYSPVCWTE